MDKLFSPLQLGALHLQNRIVMAPMTRNRAEPDLFLKPDDHIIVGTNFWALPLARFRRDLSFPNSVGFQLDRNFGNDVF